MTKNNTIDACRKPIFVFSQTKIISRIIKLHKKLNVVPPSLEDKCAWYLLHRAMDETLHASSTIFEAKAQALIILVKYGWRDVFKESLNDQGQFKSLEEAGRFEYCLN